MTTTNNSSQNLTEILHHCAAIVTFTKVNGEERVMKCTLNPEIANLPAIDPTAGVPTPGHLIHVWDLEADAWRTITIANVKSVEVVL